MVEYGNAVGSAVGGVGSSIGGLWDGFTSSVAGLLSGATGGALSVSPPAALVGGLVLLVVALLVLRQALR